jgi:hypothetical protein
MISLYHLSLNFNFMFIVETTEIGKTVQAEVLESTPDQDEKNDSLLNEAHMTNLPVRNFLQ